VRRYILRRLVTIAPTAFVVSVIAFSLLALLPGDPALAILGDERARDQVAYQALRAELGLDRPLYVQYADWVGKVLRGDFGVSTRTREPVAEAIQRRLPITLHLGLLSLLLGLAIALPTGVISAIKPGSFADVAGTIFAVGGIAIPNFWLSIVLMLVFAVWLRWLPPSGYVPPQEDLLASTRLMIMPAFVLGTGLAAVLMRQIRSALLEVMRQDYITTARVKGLREHVVVRRHALGNALIPVVTILGLQIARLFAGAVVVEVIFSIPGVGRLAVDSIFVRDFPMLQGVVLVMAMAVLISNLLTDIAYAYIDPRISHR
jgi:peptide/nickel transport system permease protein